MLYVITFSELTACAPLVNANITPPANAADRIARRARRLRGSVVRIVESRPTIMGYHYVKSELT
jgi:hypothetical protein